LLNLNGAQRSYLEDLLQTSSIDLCSSGLCSVLLHSANLDPKDLLTASLILLGTCIEHEEASVSLSSVKKSVMREAVDTFTLCSNVLGGQFLGFEEPGSEATTEDSVLLENLSPPEEPNRT